LDQLPWGERQETIVRGSLSSIASVAYSPSFLVRKSELTTQFVKLHFRPHCCSLQEHLAAPLAQRQTLPLSQSHKLVVFALGHLRTQAVGIKEVHDDIWLVSFLDYDLGYFDLETRVLEPLENPFGPKVLPMRLKYVVSPMSGPDRIYWSGRVDLNHRPPGPEPQEQRKKINLKR
jgi:hypothetical protein